MDENEECGLSWSGHNIKGDRGSILVVKDAIHQAGIVPELKDMIKSLQAERDALRAVRALTDYSYQQLFDAISAATKVTSGTEHISISVDAFRAAILAAPQPSQEQPARQKYQD